MYWRLEDWENGRERLDSEESHKQKMKGVRRRHLIGVWRKSKKKGSLWLAVFHPITEHLVSDSVNNFNKVHLLIDCSVEGHYVTNTYVFISFDSQSLCGVKASVVWERQPGTNGDGGRWNRLTYGSIISFWPLCVTLPQRGAQPLSDAHRDWPYLFWSLAVTDSRLTISHEGICIQHFIKSTHLRSTT